MVRIKFDAELIKAMSLIQKITRTSVKDVIPMDDKMMVVVPEAELSRAIGKKAENIRKIEKALNKKVRMVGFSDNVVSFIKNLIYPLKVTDITEEDGVVTVTPADLKTRGYIIGRNASALRQTESIVKRYFPIKEIKVKWEKNQME